MVIATSDSNGTLVSLNHNGLKRSGSLELLRASPSTQSYEFFPTDLLLPEEERFEEEFDDNESFYSCSSLEDRHKHSNVVRDRLYLPCSGEHIDVDECLKCLPSVLETCDDLLSKDPKHFTEQSPCRVLYVGQREVAHAVPLQCDVMMSDKATTCHILAIRSTSPNTVPLASLTHVDGTGYESCIRAMVQRHLRHHQMDDSLIAEEQKDRQVDTESDDLMDLDLHIIGGFQDHDGTSRGISNWLFGLLADISTEEKHRMKTTLRTCAVSSLNDDGRGAPIGRGLGISLRSGDVFLASCDPSAAGPDGVLRSLRLWGQDGSGPRLEVIHEESLNTVKVTPFYFAPFPDVGYLLSLPDHELLKCTSTSPECEEEDFCPRLREALIFLVSVSAREVFGSLLNRTRHYKRVGRSNTWEGLHA